MGTNKVSELGASRVGKETEPRFRFTIVVYRPDQSVYGHCKELLPAPGNRSNKRRDREEDLATTEEKDRNEGEGDEKNRGQKSRHGWTMYLNLVTSQYILYFKKCPIEGVE
ncbi:hypothetical protein TNCV_971321 [Trichonephila clavipes]|nr:hypothetical protein TNCV_971321 [Trichonephila clavipes]